MHSGKAPKKYESDTQLDFVVLILTGCLTSSQNARWAPKCIDNQGILPYTTLEKYMKIGSYMDELEEIAIFLLKIYDVPQ